jgi:hypothetical protein
MVMKRMLKRESKTENVLVKSSVVEIEPGIYVGWVHSEYLPTKGDEN